MKSLKSGPLLLLIAIALIIIVLILPLDLLEYLSIEIVGGPPINGLTWLEGVDAIGGPFSMRLLAILGILIIFTIIPSISQWEKNSTAKRKVKLLEILFFITAALVFFVINFLIGYNWWNAEDILGMGPLFFHFIASLVVIGILPDLARHIFKFERTDFADSTENLKKISLTMIVIAFGYGLISLIWHCCSFFEPKMFFFFFVIKLIQLWTIGSFFLKWGLPLFLNFTHRWVAYIIISILFGFCYPWHTFGFALTFIIFGVLLCYITQKTDSYLSGLILLYFAYIFHAGLAWQGALITFSVIYPITVVLLGILIYLHLKKNL